MISITCHGGNIGRFWWWNSDQGGLFAQGHQPVTTLRPGRIGWCEPWPDETRVWPHPPWGPGDADDDIWRDFVAFEKWFEQELEKRELDGFDFEIDHRIALFAWMSDIFQSGIQAGRNPWAWARKVELLNTTDTEEEPQP